MHISVSVIIILFTMIVETFNELAFFLIHKYHSFAQFSYHFNTMAHLLVALLYLFDALCDVFANARFQPITYDKELDPSLQSIF